MTNLTGDAEAPQPLEPGAPVGVQRRAISNIVAQRFPKCAALLETKWCRLACSSSATIVIAIGLSVLIGTLAVLSALKTTWNDDTTFLAAVMWLPACLFVLITVPLSAYDMVKHLQNYDRPLIQRYVVRILWMVPIYAVESWLSLVCSSSALFAHDPASQRALTLCIQSARELYEAFVIYSFFHFIMACLGTDAEVIALLAGMDKEKGKLILAPGAPCCWPAPLPLCKGCYRGERGRGVCCKKTLCSRTPVAALYCALPNPLLSSCKIGVLQYAVSRTLTTLVTFLTSFIPAPCVGFFPWDAAPTFEAILNGTIVIEPLSLLARCSAFAPGSQNPARVYFWVNIVNNISQAWAIYCLVLLYHAVHEDLHKWKPLPKFLVIKAVVFFSFWQSTLIVAFFTFVVKDEWLGNMCYDHAYVCIKDKDTLQDVVCDGLIVAEMLLYALAHHWIFSWKQFRVAKKGTRAKLFFEAVADPSVYRSLVDAALPTDMVAEVGMTTKVVIDDAADQIAHDVNAASSILSHAADDFEGEARHALRSIDSGARHAMAQAERAMFSGPGRGSSSSGAAGQGGLEGMAEIEEY